MVQTLGVARKPSISPSKITTYLACPVKYRYTYVDDRARWLLRAKSYYSFGTTLHRVLQRFHDSGDAGVTTTAEVLAAYEESWIDAGFSSAEEMAEAYGEGKQILERHVTETLTRPEAAKTLFVERQLRFDFGDFVLIGRLDRVDEYEDGTLEVVDYKSGRDSVAEEDVSSDIAMCCYQLLLRKKFPDKPVRARILALRSAESATHAMSEVEFNEFERDIAVLARMILSENFYERKPVRKPMCEYCDFLPACQQDPDFA
jgi:RecB family exonuclease